MQWYTTGCFLSEWWLVLNELIIIDEFKRIFYGWLPLNRIQNLAFYVSSFN